MDTLDKYNTYLPTLLSTYLTYLPSIPFNSPSRTPSPYLSILKRSHVNRVLGRYPRHLPYKSRTDNSSYYSALICFPISIPSLVPSRLRRRYTYTASYLNRGLCALYPVQSQSRSPRRTLYSHQQASGVGGVEEPTATTTAAQ